VVNLHNKATLCVQYHTKTRQQFASEKNYNRFKNSIFCSIVPHGAEWLRLWGTMDQSII